MMARSVIGRCGALPLLRPRSLIIDSIKMAVKLDVAHQPQSVLFVLEGPSAESQKKLLSLWEDSRWIKVTTASESLPFSPLPPFLTSFTKKTGNQGPAAVRSQEKLAWVSSSRGGHLSKLRASTMFGYTREHTLWCYKGGGTRTSFAGDSSFF